MIKKDYTEYQMPLEQGIILRVTVEKEIKQVTIAEVWANGQIEMAVCVPFRGIAELAEIMTDIAKAVK